MLSLIIILSALSIISLYNDNKNKKNSEYIINEYIINEYSIKKSNINGLGVFSNIYIKKGEYLFEVVNTDKNISYLGSYINHCNKPNTKLVKHNNTWWLISLNDILPNTEVIADYNDTPYFIKKPDPSWKC
jgi:hypothetical protein